MHNYRQHKDSYQEDKGWNHMRGQKVNAMQYIIMNNITYLIILKGDFIANISTGIWWKILPHEEDKVDAFLDL